MNGFHLTVAFTAIGIIVVACVRGICALMLDKRNQ